MSQVIPFKVDGQSFAVEAEPGVDLQRRSQFGSEETTSVIKEKIASNAEASLDIARDLVLCMARTFVRAMDQLEEREIPKSLELSFGIKFSAQGDIYLAKVCTESTLNIKLTYQPEKKT
jgi:hypothetical protein